MQRLWPALLAAWLLCSCKSSERLVDTAVELRREELSVSMLVVNLRDVYNEPNVPTPAGIPWQERFTRVAQWIALNEPPDVLVLQEMPGYWNGGLVEDYEAAFFLIDRIRQLSQVDYRIAYLLSEKQGGGYGEWYIGTDKRGALPTRGGKALLYRVDKIRNTQTAPGFSYDTVASASSGLLNSIPCCNVRSGTGAVCSMIDGPLISVGVDALRTGPNRSCDSPAGAAFTRRQNAPGGPIDVVFSRLELKKQPGNFIDVYNVHFAPPAPDANLERLVNDMEARFGSAGRLYPPIMAGDFNLDTAAMDVRFNPPPGTAVNTFYPRTEILHWSPELMGVLIGKKSEFPSAQKAIVRGVRNLPDFGCAARPDGSFGPSNTQTLWSDHCASIYFKLVPQLSP
jgi:hypothetical protein